MIEKNKQTHCLRTKPRTYSAMLLPQTNDRLPLAIVATSTSLCSHIRAATIQGEVSIWITTVLIRPLMRSVSEIPCSGKLLREKTFANFEVWEPSAKVFSTKFWGMPHPLMFGFKQSVKIFSVKLSLPTDPWRFSPSKVYCYTVIDLQLTNQIAVFIIIIKCYYVL